MGIFREWLEAFGTNLAVANLDQQREQIQARIMNLQKQLEDKKEKTDKQKETETERVNNQIKALTRQLDAISATKTSMIPGASQEQTPPNQTAQPPA